MLVSCCVFCCCEDWLGLSFSPTLSLLWNQLCPWHEKCTSETLMANYIKGKRVQTSNKEWLTAQARTGAITPSKLLFFNKNVSSHLFSAKVCVLRPGMTSVVFTWGLYPIWGWPPTMSRVDSRLQNVINANSGHRGNRFEAPWRGDAARWCLPNSAARHPDVFSMERCDACRWVSSHIHQGEELG